MKHIAYTVLLLLGFTAQATASWYPPDYEIDTLCREQGPVKVCMINRLSAKPYLRIEYQGYLMTDSWGRINAWVNINGRSHTFSMTNRDYKEHLSINHYRNVQLCYYNTTMPTSGGFTYCPNADENGPMEFDWYKEDPPRCESDLIGSAMVNDYVGDSQENSSGWTVELAFFDEQGRWDSLYGYNYRFQFTRWPNY